jgi:F-type H+-transporting ATPase subunit alpha
MEKPEVTEIIDILSQKIANSSSQSSLLEVGTVISIADGICRVYGLDQAMSGETVIFDNGVKGMVLNLEKYNVGIAIFGDSSTIQEGMEVRRTHKLNSVPVGKALLGRVLNPLGEPIDGLGPLETTEFRTVETKAPGIMTRKGIHEPLQTGIKAIDSMIPIGKGQRELIIGDRQTGKTAVALDTILNQKGKGIFCIYVAIGQKASTVAQFVEKLKKYNALEYTIVVMASASDSATLQFFAPYSGVAMGEYFRDNGEHALIVYDDLTKHAQSYREVSLLLRRPPGREAYPGDVFYLHSRLLERACKLCDSLGAGSLTAFPIIETQAGDVSAYIPTNVISITDGQIYLESDLFNSGVRPAINAGLSVSRVGGSAQTAPMKQVAGTLRLELAQYRDLQAFSQFASDLDAATRQQLVRGQRLTELLKQKQYSPLAVESQILILFAATQGFLDKKDLNMLASYEKSMLEYFRLNHPDILASIADGKKMSKEFMENLRTILQDFDKKFENHDI